MKRATNLKSMKQRNQKLVLNLIRRENYSRADIAAAIRLTKPAVSAIVDELMEQGIVYDVPAENPGYGRPPHWLRISPKACYCIGVDITRRSVSVGIINAVGDVLCEQTFPVGEVEETLRHASDIMQEQIDAQGIDRERILGIGITTPGPMDKVKQTILQPTNFPGWHHAKVGELLTSMTGWRVWMDNIANAWALSETYFGTARNLHNFLTLTVDSGVGSGIIIDDKIFDGVNEIGHTSIYHNGPLCECGQHGCLELYARMPDLLKGTGYQSWHEVVKKDDHALICKEAEYLSSAIVSVANLFRLEMVVLASDIGRDPHPIAEIIQNMVSERRPKMARLPVCATEIHSAVLCAATLALNSFFQ